MMSDETEAGTVQVDAALAEAKRLIKAGRYAEARVLLTALDHRKARRWLAQLDRDERLHPARSEALTAALIVAGLVLAAGLIYALVRGLLG